MKLSFLVALFLAVAAKQVYSQACHMREVDLCIAIGMFHYQSNGIPPDDEKVTEWCETMTEVGDCMSNFTAKCMSPLQREVIGLIAGSGDNAKQLCTSGSELRSNYLSHSECLANGAETDEVKSEMKDLQVMVEKLFDVTFDERFPLLCCGLRRFHENIELLTEQNCGKPSVEMLQIMFKMIMTDLPEIICKPYDPKSQECLNVLPAPGTPSKGADNQTQLGKLLDTVLGNL